MVLLEPVDGAPPPVGGQTVSIVQRDRTIVPHVTVVRVGQTVRFPNEDDVFHNIFSLSPENRFSLGRYAPGTTQTHRFEHTGEVRLFCDIHSEMAGVILVVSTPWFARADGSGAFRLPSLPAGRYRAIAWHPTAGADTITVTLADGVETRLDFTLPARR